MNAGKMIDSQSDFCSKQELQLEKIETIPLDLDSFVFGHMHFFGEKKDIVINNSLIALRIHMKAGMRVICFDDKSFDDKSLDEKNAFVRQQVVIPLLAKINNSLFNSPCEIVGYTHGVGVLTIYLKRKNNDNESISSQEKFNIALLVNHSMVVENEFFKQCLIDMIRIYIRNTCQRMLNPDNNILIGIQNFYYSRNDSQYSPDKKLHVANALLNYIQSENILQGLCDIPKYLFETFLAFNSECPVKDNESLSAALKEGKLGEIYSLCEKYLHMIDPHKEEIEKHARTLAVLFYKGFSLFSILPCEVNAYIASLTGDRVKSRLEMSNRIAVNAYHDCHHRLEKFKFGK